jgi:redox-sensitive bicupin YhaK (pirin superfamily)
MEIVTGVLSGELEHKDSEGNKGIIYPGLAQRMSAGTGIWHSEMNPSGDEPVHFVQMWVLPDTERVNPGYEQLDIRSELSRGGLVPVASGRGHDSAISIRQRDAVLLAGHLAPGERVKLPEAPYAHLFVPTGSVELEGAGRLDAGDAVRITGSDGSALVAGDGGADVLVWEMHAGLRVA